MHFPRQRTASHPPDLPPTRLHLLRDKCNFSRVENGKCREHALLGKYFLLRTQGHLETRFSVSRNLFPSEMAETPHGGLGSQMVPGRGRAGSCIAAPGQPVLSRVTDLPPEGSPGGKEVFKYPAHLMSLWRDQSHPPGPTPSLFHQAVPMWDFLPVTPCRQICLEIKRRLFMAPKKRSWLNRFTWPVMPHLHRTMKLKATL